MVNLIPGRGWLLAKEVEQNAQTDGGLYLPESAQRPYRTFTVVAVGRAATENGIELPRDYETGDEILLYPNGGISLEDGYVLARQNEVLGRFPS